MNVFTNTQLKLKADDIVSKYETKRASILEILRLIQEEHGHITLGDERAVADYLQIPVIEVREVMTFYTLFYDKPKAKTRFNVCHTLTCSLLGSDEIIRYFEDKLGIKAGKMTPDGQYSLKKVECLGACEIGPMLQVNDCAFVGNLTREKVDELIAKAQK